MEQILTAAEVAAMLQVHIRTVYRLAERGDLPGRRIGRGWRFRKDEVLTLLSNPGSADPPPGLASALSGGKPAAE